MSNNKNNCEILVFKMSVNLHFPIPIIQLRDHYSNSNNLFTIIFKTNLFIFDN